MKKVLLLLLIFTVQFSFFKSMAQAPQAISYQAVASNIAGNPIVNHPISLRFSIHNATIGGNVVYQETQNTNTNSFGSFTVNIGKGVVVSGNFSTVDWGGGSKYLQVELDPAGGVAYVNMGTEQMLSVPYALNAGNVNWTKTSNDISNLNSGNVGIGTTSPSQKLDVNGNIATNTLFGKGTLIMSGISNDPILAKPGIVKLTAAPGNQYPGGDVTINGGGSSLFYGHIDGGAKISLKGWNYDGNSNISLNIGGGIGGVGSTSNFLYINDVNGTHLMTVADIGKVGIGTETPTEKLHVNGNGLFSGTVTASCGLLLCSDIRYKKTITPLKGSLEKVCLLNGVNYFFRKDEFPEKNFHDDKQIGVIAQELEKIYPELVHTDEQGYKSVDYAKLTPVLVEAIKELSAQNDKLKTDVDKLNAENSSFKTDIRHIKEQLGMDVKASK